MLLPAPKPAKRLYPAAPSTRRPPMLYCVAAFTVLPESVPSAVPLPLILKFDEACCVVVFCT